MSRTLFVITSLVVAAARAFAAEAPVAKPAQAMALLKANCLSCHNEEKKKGGLVMTTRAAALKGGENGAALVSGKSSQSLLIKSLDADADPHMPPKKQLAEKDVVTLRAWIDAGATWDEKALKAFGVEALPEKLTALPGSYQPVLAIALSPDEKRLAVARANQVLVHDLSQTNRPVIATLALHRDAVQALAWSADGKWLAAAEYRRVALWDAQTFKLAKDFTNGITNRVTALQFTPDNATLVFVDGAPTKSGVVHVLSVVDGKPVATWLAHKDSILALNISRDGKWLATGSADKTVKIWELATQKELAKFESHLGHVLTVAFNPDASKLATGGADKVLNFWNTKTREQEITLKQIAPVTAVAWAQDGKVLFSATDDGMVKAYSEFKAHTGRETSEAARDKRFASAGELLHGVAASADGKTVFAGSHEGSVYVWNSDGKLKATLKAAVPTNAVAEPTLSFINDVLPVLSKAGCNAGSCHAKPDGQNGFKLSVFAYDPKSDFAGIVKADRSRRVFPALPEESLLLKKATLAVEHEGGQRIEAGSAAHQTLVKWIREGMPYTRTNEPALVEIKVTPRERVYRKGETQRLRVEARYSDGRVRDVSDLAEFASNDKETARVDENGLVKAGNYSGEASVVARFMGLVDVSRVTVPADKLLPDSLYAALPVNNEIDRLVYTRLKTLGIAPSVGCTDAEFLRRASLDATGVLPTAEQAREFLADKSSDKRKKLIDRLLAHPAYADLWAVKWGDWIRPNPSRVGVKPVYLLDQWLRESFRANKPYDQFVRELLTATGSSHKYGPVALFRDKRDPIDATSFVGQIFLGTRLECAKCHHHPNEKWGQTEYFQLAAYFGQTKRKGQGISAPISGEAEFMWFAPGGDVKHPVTGEVMKPKPLDGPAPQLADRTDPRGELVNWMTQPDNPFFARSAVNRVWAQFFGRGIVDPMDDMRASNPPVNEPLLDWLARDFVAHRFDLKQLIRTIMSSHVYQLSSLPNEYNQGDTKYFSRAYRRRLPAEVLLDAVSDVTGAAEKFQGLPEGARALDTWNHKLDSEFMDAFGRPNASAECPCERDTKTSVVQALHLMNSKRLQSKIASDDGRARALAKGTLTEKEIVNELYLSIYNRPPIDDELSVALKVFSAKDATRQTATEDVMWALLNSAEFVFNH